MAPPIPDHGPGVAGGALAFSKLALDLLPFQRRFMAGALKPGVRTACLSLPRGNGKSTLAGHLATRIMTPSDPLFVSGSESVLVASSLEQARVVFRILRAALQDTGAYAFADSITQVRCRHKPTKTVLRAVGANGRTLMGLVGVPNVIVDEPGAMQVAGGELIHAAITTAMGKPNSPLKAWFFGTIAPSASGWWRDLATSESTASTYVQTLMADPEKWLQWRQVRRVNPLMSQFPSSLAVLRDEWLEAKTDDRLQARFKSYRMNVPTGDPSALLLQLPEWDQVLQRDPDELGRKGSGHIVGLDLGHSRAWSAAVSLQPTGTMSALAVAPGIPSLADQERRDRVPSGTYQKLHKQGVLRVDEGKRVVSPELLVNAVNLTWGRPDAAWCDRFRLDELQDAASHWNLEPRVTRWSESAEDIRAFRRMALDGPLAVTPESRTLLTVSLSAATVKADDAGNFRLIKRNSHNTARDDVISAAVLAAGAWHRAQKPSLPRWRYVGEARAAA